jgi:high-affinity nickel permease
LRAAQKLKDEVISKLIEELNALEEDPKSGEHLEALLHKRGINMRLMGRLCTSVRFQYVLRVIGRDEPYQRALCH